MRTASAAFACALCLLCGSPAHAYWQAPGAGVGTAVSATLPAGEQPTVSASGDAVTVSWKQSMFLGRPIGTFDGGGYVIARQPAGGGAAVTPSAGCDATVSGAGATLSCEELSVPPGSWTYTVTPVLMTWTGESSAAVAPIFAPVQAATAPQNPTVAQTTGDVRVSWAAATGADGYNVYRRTASGSYDYSSPLNGATPLTGTTYDDTGSGLAAGTTYAYVVRAVQGNPAAEGASSNERTASPVSRPAAPANVTATAAPAARISVSWATVSGAAGYNVYRRTTTGAYNYASPLNGATPVTGDAYTDATSVDGTGYRYAVRAVTTGTGGTPIESPTGTESAVATADSVATPMPTSVTVGAGAGPLQTTATCGYGANTRFVNFAGQTSVPVTVVIPVPEAGETVTLTATTAGSTPVTATIAATTTTINTTIDLSTLLDGAVTLTARTSDAAGNSSATQAPTTAIHKDTAAELGGLGYIDYFKGTADRLSGTAECGARITAVQTTGPAPGSTYPTSGTYTVGSTDTFTTFAVAALRQRFYAYDVTATDLAANAATVAISGYASR